MALDYQKEGKVAIFTINRPEALNALNMDVMRELHEAMVDFRDDDNLWVGIITGAGNKAFSAGADIKSAMDIRKERAHDWPMWASPMCGMDLWKPLIAAINGVALGGGLEIVLACDIRIAAETARLGLPEVTLGLLPGMGGTQRLPRMIPWCKAAELVLLGKPIDAQEAYRIGLVNQVVPPEQVMPTAREWAEALCRVGPLGVRYAKEAMLRGYNLSLEDGLRLENSLFAFALDTEDFREARAAFLEKRKPEFKGK
ncbi:MAG: enoyl-CoA hydratase-related protein [Chloroflexota bacterium]